MYRSLLAIFIMLISINCLAKDANNFANLIQQYSNFGAHLTGSNVDQQTSKWLANRLQQDGLQVKISDIPFQSVYKIKNQIIYKNLVIPGFPAYDGMFTSAKGIIGKLGLTNTKADILVLEIPVNIRANGGALLDSLRMNNQYKAIIAITRADVPGLALMDNVYFPKQVGVPILQVSSIYSQLLLNLAKQHATVNFIADNIRQKNITHNIFAYKTGTEKQLAPITISVPYTAWTPAAAEHGVSVACWLTIAKNLAKQPTKRSIQWVAFSGHEIGAIGFHALLQTDPLFIKNSAAWFHLGANIGGLPLQPIIIGSNQASTKTIILTLAKQTQLNIHWQNQMLGEPEYAILKQLISMPVFSMYSYGNQNFRMQTDIYPNNVDVAIAEFACGYYQQLIAQYVNHN